MEWLTVDKTYFCLRGSAEGCHQNAEAEYDVTALCCGACRARRDVEIKLHPPALPSPFRLSRQNSSSHSKCEASGRGRGCLKTLCRVRRQTLITSNTDKSMVVKHTANCFSDKLFCLSLWTAEAEFTPIQTLSLNMMICRWKGHCRKNCPNRKMISCSLCSSRL